MRINKYLALCGLASRRKCEEYVLSGKIKVDGKVISNLATDINESNVVECEDKKLSIPNDYVYYKLNKPKGYICTNKDDKGRKTIYKLVPSDIRLFTVGRLDYNTEGLIILTNDGDFSEQVSHPSYEKEKEYIVKIEGKMLESELAVLRAGVVENGKRMPEAKVEQLDYIDGNTRLSVVIHEGQNRQIRRMFECINRNIILLKRVRIGNVRLGGLSRGKYKQLTEEEIASLKGLL